MGCLSSKPATTAPSPSPAKQKPVAEAFVASKVEPNSPQKVNSKAAAPATNVAASAPNGQASIPGSIPDSDSKMAASPAPSDKNSPDIMPTPPRNKPDEPRKKKFSTVNKSSAARQSSSDSGAPRPSSAGRKREGTNENASNRPGSAGKNRGESVKPSVWLSDTKSRSTAIKHAEAKVDKDIFRNGSPKKGRITREDPGPMRPTTAKQRDRPSSAERNRNEAVKPAVWLEDVSRESNAGTRSLYECSPTDSKKQRPSSADRKRLKQETNNPSSQVKPIIRPGGAAEV